MHALAIRMFFQKRAATFDSMQTVLRFLMAFF
jgi:hypothetical protein